MPCRTWDDIWWEPKDTDMQRKILTRTPSAWNASHPLIFPLKMPGSSSSRIKLVDRPGCMSDTVRAGGMLLFLVMGIFNGIM